MRKEDIRVVVFAAVVCVICSLLLSITAQSLKDRQDKEVEFDRKKNVLKAFGVNLVGDDGTPISKEAVDTYFTVNISEIYIDKETGNVVENPDPTLIRKEQKERTHVTRSLLPLYVWRENGEATKYAFPTSGMGLWSIVNGYLALEKDLSTVIGVTFYKHGETPGLGGEVSTEWFQSQFADKKIFENGKLIRLEVVKGGAPDGSNHQVDGISGATMTGNGLNIFINRDLSYYDKYFSRIRGT